MSEPTNSGFGDLTAPVHPVEARLVKVEGKLDNIAVALTSLVRIEERQIAMTDRLTDGATDLKKHEDRLTGIEATIHRSTGARDVIIWVVGLIQVLVLGIGGYVISTMNSVNDRLAAIDIKQAEHRAIPHGNGK